MAEPKTTDPIKDNKNKLVVSEDDNNNNNDPDMAAVATKKTKKKKKKKSVNIFKVALMLILRRPAKPNSVAVDVASKGMWKNLFASMRPLHLQCNEVVGSTSLHPAEEHADVVVDPGLRASPSVENFQDVSSFPLSPEYIPKSASVSSLDEMSRYASAVNLQELDQNDKDENENESESENENENENESENENENENESENENENENENNNITEANMDGGDEMIDAKAEMFIAQFYQQMKLQRSDSDVHYMEMITRSIG